MHSDPIWRRHDSKGFLEPTLDFAMRTPTARQQHSRPVTRYQTDLTDAEWRVIAPHLPRPCSTGRPRVWPMREILNGIFYGMRAERLANLGDDLPLVRRLARRRAL
jgi:Putative transposase of IS4/5 family (DUF4096)